MPIPENHLKERLSMVYLSAIAAQAGVECTFKIGAEYGTDALITAVVEVEGVGLCDTGPVLPIQLKATTAWELRNGSIVYEMEADAYNKIVTRRGTPCILVLLCLPTTRIDWFNIDDQQLILKKCCYWERLCGDATPNKRSQTIHISQEQILTPEVVLTLLDRAMEGTL